MNDSYKRLLLESLRDFIRKLRDKLKGEVDPGNTPRPGATPSPDEPKGSAHMSRRRGVVSVDARKERKQNP